MKKNIFLIAIAIVSFTFSANAQGCCSSKAKDKTSCNKTSATVETKSIQGEAKAILVHNGTTAANKTETFTVYGNCGMCERTIEASLKDVNGVSEADWNRDTDVMTVTFDTDIITLDAIKQRIADVGYDSDSHRAKDEIYNALPGCCQYDRPNN